MTKEDLLRDHDKYAWECDESERVVPFSAAENAMGEYAKQQAIDFIKWAMSAALQGDHYGGVMLGLPLGPNNEEEAYNQFIESQNK